MKTPRAVIFDLDGTLLDTLADISNAANEVLCIRGFPQHSYDAFKRFVGEGVLVLFSRALPEENRQQELIAACAHDFEASYGRHWNRLTTPYAGIAELLATLQDRTLPMAVLSNKPHAFTQKCVAEYFPDVPFGAVFGQRPGIPRKPDPAAALEICQLLSVAPSEVLYLGDSNIDMQTACNAGMIPIGVSWGFRDVQELRDHGAHAIIYHPAEMLNLLRDES